MVIRNLKWLYSIYCMQLLPISGLVLALSRAELLWRKLSRKCVCEYRTYHPHLLSTIHVNAELYGAPLLNYLRGAWRCGTKMIWPLHATRGSAIQSHPPNEASDRIHRSNINGILAYMFARSTTLQDINSMWESSYYTTHVFSLDNIKRLGMVLKWMGYRSEDLLGRSCVLLARPLFKSHHGQL